MSTTLSLLESLETLSKNKIPVAESIQIENSFELSRMPVPYPWALKLSSEHISHKTEQNAVRLNISNREQATKSFLELRRLDSRGKIILQPQLVGTELLIGASIDNQFGQTILIGIGGTMVELLNDTSLRVLPINQTDGLEMISELKNQKILDGYRGKPAVDKKKWATIIVQTAKMIQQNHFAELDINPLMATKNGIFAVDARIVK